MEDSIPPEQQLRRLHTHHGVRGYLIMNSQAIPIKHDGMDAKKAVQYASLLSELVHLTEKFVESEPELDNSRTAVTSNAEAPAQQQLVTLRLRTLKHELIIAPDHDFTLVTVHNPNYVEPVAKALEAEE